MMNSKKFVRIVAIVLAIIMLLSVAMIIIESFANSKASAVTQDEINKLREEKRQYEREKNEINIRINSIEFERMAEIDKKEILDERIRVTSLEIDNINETINQYEMLIGEKEYEIVVAQNREEYQLEKYKLRVRDMEENGIISYLEILFDSTSFSDLLARYDFVQDIMRADENTYLALQAAKSLTNSAKEVLEETKAEMDEELLKAEELKEDLQEQLDEAQALIDKMLGELETNYQLRDMVRENEERVQNEINAAVAELEKQRLAAARAAAAAAAANAGSNRTYTTGSGVLMWPVNGPVTSEFGKRRHPVYGDIRDHTGIDIGVPHGTSVVAADSGTVITSAYDSGYGNYIVISHGSGVTTLYAHLSSRSVSAGASVSKGQQIGLVGSTGVSTGPHLHFEVSVNGSRVNPLTRL